MRWFALWLLFIGAMILLALLIGCSETVDVGFEPLPEPVQVEQFTANEEVEEEPGRDMGLEPVIIIPKLDDWRMWAILKARARADSSGSE